jgi:hypothetical protein
MKTRATLVILAVIVVVQSLLLLSKHAPAGSQEGLIVRAALVEKLIKSRGASLYADEYEALVRTLSESTELHVLALSIAPYPFDDLPNAVETDALFGAANEALSRRKGQFDAVLAAALCDQVTLDVRVTQFVRYGAGTQAPRSAFAQDYLRSVIPANHGRDREKWFLEVRVMCSLQEELTAPTP